MSLVYQPEPTDSATRAIAVARDRRGRLPVYWLAGFVIVLDQIAKALVRQMLPLHESVNVIAGLLDFTHVQNTGAAFGILNTVDFPFKSAVVLSVALAAFAAIAIYTARLGPEEKLARVGLALVLGGAIGNLIDRAMVGYVVDFVDVYWGDLHFWAFNVADAAITIGACIVLVDVLGLVRRRHHAG